MVVKYIIVLTIYKMPKISYWYDKNKKKEYLKEYQKKYQENYKKRKKETIKDPVLEIESQINNIEEFLLEMKNELEEIENEYYESLK